MGSAKVEPFLIAIKKAELISPAFFLYEKLTYKSNTASLLGPASKTF